MNYFSIIIPCCNKADGIGRCLQSLISQTYGNFEVIVIDDGSTDDSPKVIKSFLKDKRVRGYFLPKNHGRLAARNMGMRMARNDWICWLDADDIYLPDYLSSYDKAVSKNRDIKIFNSGMLIKNKIDGWRIVEPVPESDIENISKGRIGSGSFVFHKSLMWFFPENVKHPYGIDDTFPGMLVDFDKNFEQICKKKDGHWQPLGNPWGDDYSYFWYITRKNKTKMINSLLYVQYVR